MRGRTAFLTGLLIASAILAGCLGDEDAAPAAPPGRTEEDGDADRYAVDDRDLRDELQPDDELPAPDWEIGQWFGVHVYFLEPGFEEDHHFDLVVVEDRGDAYNLATPDEEIAKQHALWGYPGLGAVDKQDLAFNGIGATWDWMYDFPLSDGKSWTRDITVPGFTGVRGEVRTSFTATYTERIETTDGERPGFQIEGRAEDGLLIVQHDFVPAVGWFAHFRLHNTTGDEILHMMSMGFGTGWTGTYYEYESELLVEHSSIGVFAPQPYVPFEVDADAAIIAGVITVTAFVGVQSVVLIDPEGDHHETTAYPDPDSGGTFGYIIERFEHDAIAGEWHLASVGAGLLAASFALIWQLWRGEYTL